MIAILIYQLVIKNARSGSQIDGLGHTLFDIVLAIEEDGEEIFASSEQAIWNPRVIVENS